MLVVKCFNSLFEGKCGLYASFYKSWKIKLQVIEIWIRWAWTKSLLSLAYMIKIQEKRDGDTMGTHLPAPHASTSHRGGWLSQTSFTLVEPPAQALRLSMGEFLHERAWKEGTEQAAEGATRGGVLGGFSTLLPQDAPVPHKRPLWSVGLFWVTCPGLASVWQTPAREGSRGMAWGSG